MMYHKKTPCDVQPSGAITSGDDRAVVGHSIPHPPPRVNAAQKPPPGAMLLKAIVAFASGSQKKHIAADAFLHLILYAKSI